MSLPMAVFNETHLILLLIILLLLFGGKKLPELAKGLGEAMREFKKASRDIHEEPPPAVPKPDQSAPAAGASQNNQTPKSS